MKAAAGAGDAFCAQMQLRVVSRPTSLPSGLVVAEAIVPPGSSFVGKTVADARLRTRFGVDVMAVFRSTTVLRESVAHTTPSVGDLLLLLGSEKALRKLRDTRGDAILVTETEALRQAQFRTERATHAVAILVAMLLAMAFEIAPPVVAVVCAALAMVLIGCIDVQSADKTIS